MRQLFLFSIAIALIGISVQATQFDQFGGQEADGQGGSPGWRWMFLQRDAPMMQNKLPANAQFDSRVEDDELIIKPQNKGTFSRNQGTEFDNESDKRPKQQPSSLEEEFFGALQANIKPVTFVMESQRPMAPYPAIIQPISNTPMMQGRNIAPFVAVIKPIPPKRRHRLFFLNRPSFTISGLIKGKEGKDEPQKQGASGMDSPMFLRRQQIIAPAAPQQVQPSEDNSENGSPQQVQQQRNGLLFGSGMNRPIFFVDREVTTTGQVGRSGDESAATGATPQKKEQQQDDSIPQIQEGQKKDDEDKSKANDEKKWETKPPSPKLIVEGSTENNENSSPEKKMEDIDKDNNKDNNGPSKIPADEPMMPPPIAPRFVS